MCTVTEPRMWVIIGDRMPSSTAVIRRRPGY
jgi:hypothetical protein